MVLSFFRRFSSSASDRRVDPRSSRIDGRISIDGRAYPLRDWSRRGFSAGAYGGEHYPGDKIKMSVQIDQDGEPLEFDCRAVVVWVDRDRKELAGVFTQLDRGLQDQIMRRLFPAGAGAPADPSLHP
jgi:hypothetical protein